MRAVIFDMDGVLIDSEPLWHAAEIAVFRTVGVELTEAMCLETTGLRIDEVAQHHRRRVGWDGPPPSAIAEAIVDRMVDAVGARGQPLPGVEAAVATCTSRGLTLALASSSPTRLIEATLNRLNLAGRFAVVTSAADEPYGKPHPAVFIRAAERLDVAPADCLVVEDSVNGVIAAKAARMRCVAVPQAGLADDPRFVLCDARLSSLEEFGALLDRFLSAGVKSMA